MLQPNQKLLDIRTLFMRLLVRAARDLYRLFFVGYRKPSKESSEVRLRDWDLLGGLGRRLRNSVILGVICRSEGGGVRGSWGGGTVVLVAAKNGIKGEPSVLKTVRSLCVLLFASPRVGVGAKEPGKVPHFNLAVGPLLDPHLLHQR